MSSLIIIFFFSQGYAGNFRKYSASSIDSLGTAYDYGSVMHYGAKYFSKNEKPTIEVKKLKAGVSDYNETELSGIRAVAIYGYQKRHQKRYKSGF